LVEQLTLNQRVQGSSPCAPTIEIKGLGGQLELYASQKWTWEAATDPALIRMVGVGQTVNPLLLAQSRNTLFLAALRPTFQAPTSGSPAAPAKPSGSNDPVSSDHKLAFLNGNVDRRTVSSDRVEPPADAYVLQAGSIIPAALLTGLRSDLPGLVTAQVTEDVYDTPTGRFLLIPQGARLLGQYDAQISFGQSRALLVWNRLIMPNGRSIVLERQPGADSQGYAGVEDQVDNHWGMLFEGALLSTLLSIGSEAGANNNENALVQAFRQGSSQPLSQVGEQVVGHSLNVQATIPIRPGFPVRVIVNRDLVLEPYAD
jgi:type IV secretion system protein TrbI